MPVLKYDESEAEVVAPGLIRRKVFTSNLMTVIIDYSGGIKSEPDPYHNHPHEQTAYVASGEVLFFLEGEEPQHLKAGDMYYVPSGKNHCVQWLSPTVRLVDNFNPIREDFLKK